MSHPYLMILVGGIAGYHIRHAYDRSEWDRMVAWIVFIPLCALLANIGHPA